MEYGRVLSQTLHYYKLTKHLQIVQENKQDINGLISAISSWTSVSFLITFISSMANLKCGELLLHASMNEHNYCRTPHLEFE